MIHVQTKSGGYDIVIENGCFDQLKEELAGKQCAVVTDETVDALYGKQLRALLEGCDASVLVLPPGEKTKNLTTLGQIYSFLAEAGISRSGWVVALGGGVIGDIAGFAAATYLRGVKLLQVPTTLLSQVDSSVGGKTAIDLPQGKNLAGSFYPPNKVLIDPLFLNTLPKRVFCDGMAEVIKYAAIRDAQLFELLAGDWQQQLPAIIRRCVTIKQQIVQRDEFEQGERMLLNFGHTFGHVVEKLYHYETYTHGEAVAIGMARITKKTEQMGLTAPGTYRALEQMLKRHHLWFDLPAFDVEDAKQVLLRDKKASQNNIRYVILEQIGQAKVVEFPKDQLFLLEG